MLSRPGMTIWSNVSFQLITAYWSVSIAFNILLTIAIVTRLLVMRHRIGKAMTVAGPYVSVSAMLIESAFLYSACGIAFLIAYGINSPVQNLILPTLAQVEVRCTHGLLQIAALPLLRYTIVQCVATSRPSEYTMKKQLESRIVGQLRHCCEL